MYRYGQQVRWASDNPASSASYAARACELGSSVGCNNHAVVLRETDSAQASTLFERACVGGVAVACAQVAAAAPDRLLPEHLATDAFPGLAAACESDARPSPVIWTSVDTSTCETAGLLLLTARGVARDVERGRAMLRRHARFGARIPAVALSLDGEGCGLGCRGTAARTSSCIASTCVADLIAGESCAVDRKCVRGTYCTTGDRRCAPQKPAGAPCQWRDECETEFCDDRGVCAHAPNHINAAPRERPH